MRTLHTTLAEATAGRRRDVWLVGEPGIGKTRTAMEFAAEADRPACRRADIVRAGQAKGFASGAVLYRCREKLKGIDYIDVRANGC